jgi:hypothetical protein
VRTSLLLFRGSILVFAGIQGAHEVVPAAAGASAPGALFFVRRVMTWLNAAIAWLSPLSYLTRGMEAVEIGSAGSYAFLLGSSVLYTVVLLALAIRALQWKGVRKR